MALDLSAALGRDGEEGLVSPQEANVLLARKQQHPESNAEPAA
jgi:hypothetical protein